MAPPLEQHWCHVEPPARATRHRRRKIKSAFQYPGGVEEQELGWTSGLYPEKHTLDVEGLTKTTTARGGCFRH